MPGNFKGRKQGARSKERRETKSVRRARRSRETPRKDLSREEFGVMKERLKFFSAEEAAKELVLGKRRSASSFLKVARMVSFESKRKGSKSAWNDSMINNLVTKIEEEPAISLHDMLEWATKQGYPSVSLSTLHRYLIFG
jgi:hypothetical protein